METSHRDKKQTPVPGTAAEDGRRELGAKTPDHGPPTPGFQEDFLPAILKGLSGDRLAAYDPDREQALAHYLFNLALCESLYGPLHLCEVALRNSLHQHLTSFTGQEDWFGAPHFPLTEWARYEVAKAREKLQGGDEPVTPGRIVAQLSFGFWTSLLEAHYEQAGGYLPRGIRQVFPHLPKSRHRRKELKRTVEEIRQLRNRVFHHRRISHWADAEARHERILEVTGWINPAVADLARTLSRFPGVRAAGLPPWQEHVRALRRPPR